LCTNGIQVQGLVVNTETKHKIVVAVATNLLEYRQLELDLDLEKKTKDQHTLHAYQKSKHIFIVIENVV
jgi:hypothetical protein